MVKGPEDNKESSKYLMQQKNGWDKVIQGYLTTEWLEEAKELEEETDTPDILSVTIAAMWEIWEEA
jgi:hypothetical protein